MRYGWKVWAWKDISMEIVYRKLEAADLDQVIELRIDQLRDEGAEELFDLRPMLYEYYNRHLSDESYIAWLAESEGRIIGTSGMSFVEKPPYYSNPSGKIGLLSSMYVKNEYRRRGIARELLGRVVEEARRHGCGMVHITASDMGVPLYSDFGFVPNKNFMQYVFDAKKQQDEAPAPLIDQGKEQ